MTKFHINGEGNPGKCSAASGNCPFGGEANHYSTEANARKAFELSMAASAVPQKKTRKSSETIAKDATEARKAREFANLFTLHNYNAKANEDDSDRLDPTYERLQELAAAKPVGTMFERADRLKKAYKKFAAGDTSGNFVQAEDMSYWSYLQVVAPATAHVNYAMTNSFEEEGWSTGNGSTEHYEANAKAFKKILELDLRKKDSPEKAAEFLREAGWDVSEPASEEWTDGVQSDIQKAMISGKKVAESYGGQYKYEGTHLF